MRRNRNFRLNDINLPGSSDGIVQVCFSKNDQSVPDDFRRIVICIYRRTPHGRPDQRHVSGRFDG